MSAPCTCQTEIEAALVKRFVENSPEATGHKATLCGYGLTLSQTVSVRAYMPVKMTAVFPLKKGGTKSKTSEINMFFSYCPFCGMKTDDQSDKTAAPTDHILGAAEMVQSAEPKTVAADSDTKGMTLGERIAHVGGRTNDAGYIEFGSVMAVAALIRHMVRDLPSSTVPQLPPTVYSHKWDCDGERCEKCGDKDWMGGSCSVPDASQQPASAEIDVTEAADILRDLIENIETHGLYSKDSTLIFLNQVLMCLRPAAQQQTPTDKYAIRNAALEEAIKCIYSYRMSTDDMEWAAALKRAEENIRALQSQPQQVAP